jgi:hypothetical protein
MINTIAWNCTSYVIILLEHSNGSTSHFKGLGSMPGQCMWGSVVDRMALGRVWSQVSVSCYKCYILIFHSTIVTIGFFSPTVLPYSLPVKLN